MSGKGTEAMYSGGARRRLAHLWQLPLLLFALILFVCASWLFVNARPKITLNQKLSPAREMLRNDRPDAAVESISRLLAAERFEPASEGQIHLLLAEAVDASQKQRRQSVAANHVRIIEQTQIALAQGVKPTGEIHRRVGEAYEALNKPVEAVSQYRQAIAMDPPRAIRLQRKVIDLQLATSDWAPAEASLDAYLAVAEITDAERAWAKNAKAQLLIDRGQFVEARRLLDEALADDNTELAQAETRYRLGICAWKLGNAKDAEKLLREARGSFRGQHPLDADAAFALGNITQERGDAAAAIAFFDAVIKDFPDASVAPLAKLARGLCLIQKGTDDAGTAELVAVARSASSAGSALHDPALAALRKASQILSLRGNHQAAIELLAQEQALEPAPTSGFFSRLATAYEKRAEQIEQSIADAAATEKVRREQLFREFCMKAGDANLACSRSLSAAGDKGYAEPLWKAIDLFARGGASSNAVTALEMFVSERAADPIAPAALLRLAATYESAAQADKAISAYQRLQGGYAQSPEAVKAAVPLAMLYIAQGPQKFSNAESVLSAVKPNDPGYARALFELGSLSQRMGKFDDAIARLEQFLARFHNDEHSGEAMFLAAECHRGSAEQVNVQLASATASADGTDPAGMNSAAATKKLHLSKAFDLYASAGERYGSAPPTREIDQRYQKLSALRRADCAYELGNFPESIRLYEAAAARFAEDPVALAANVQIVNAYSAMGKVDEARAANVNVRAVLSRMPQGAFASGGLSISKAYWEQWLEWAATTAR
jgi:tetratricopeptide (TPR) repeat protein